VIANNPRQDFDQPGCQDGLRLTLTMARQREFLDDKGLTDQTAIHEAV